MLVATPSRSGDSHIAASTSPRSDDAHSTVSQKVQNLVEEVLSWQKRNKTQHIPPKHGDDSEARNLGIRALIFPWWTRRTSWFMLRSSE